MNPSIAGEHVLECMCIAMILVLYCFRVFNAEWLHATAGINTGPTYYGVSGSNTITTLSLISCI